MTDFDIHAKRAFVQTADAALRNATVTACEACGDHQGKAYVFHYARKTGVSRTSYGTSTSYEDISARVVMLCEACIAQHRQAKRKEWTLKLVAGLPFAGAGIVAVVLSSGVAQTLAGILALMAGMWVLGSLVMLREFGSLEKVGRRLALRLHQKELEAQGFSEFWTNLDLAAMRGEVEASA